MANLNLNTQQILNGLKDFQRRSVEYVFNRLYIDEQTTNRFLVADEVGLGKTMIARGVIAKAVDYLKDTVERIDVIYICSNADIAKQNINRLNITGEQDFALASRVTLLPLKIKELAGEGRKVNFVSFTPNTSFNLGFNSGIKQERAMLYHILQQAWGLGTRMGPINLLQCGAKLETWRHYVEGFTQENKIDEQLSEKFICKIDAKIAEQRSKGVMNIRERYEELCDRYGRARKHIPKKDREDANRLIGELRTLLAESCIHAMEPNIIILDEFQRFKSLLDGQDDISMLANHLFAYPDVKIVLLSATPYKMYTMDHEQQDDDHYRDFIRTCHFLFNRDVDTTLFRQHLKQYRSALYDAVGSTDTKQECLSRLVEAKGLVETKLKSVMIRTERIRHTLEQDSMIKENRIHTPLEPNDIKGFAMFDQVARILAVHDQVEYWKSAPYLLNFMDDYVIKNKYTEFITTPDGRTQMGEILAKFKEQLIDGQQIAGYKGIEPANPKMRSLIQGSMQGNGWKLLWLPPALPYYRSTGIYAEENHQGFCKQLIFSSWKIVPKAISLLASYEAERRMVLSTDPFAVYQEERRKRAPLLRFSRSDNRFAGMSALTLLYPCITLAKEIDPLQLSQDLMDQDIIPDSVTICLAARERIAKLVENLPISPQRVTKMPDERWYWVTLAALDRFYANETYESWQSMREGCNAWRTMLQKDTDEDSSFAEHVDYFYNFDVNELGTPPADLLDICTKIALGSPAVAALRGLSRMGAGEAGAPPAETLTAAANIALGFRTLYNLPETIAFILSLGSSEPYWLRTLDYGIEGNIQAVLDEYFHVLLESLGLLGKDVTMIAKDIGEEVISAVSLRTTTIEFDDIFNKSTSEVYSEPLKVRCRCRYALKFGDGKNADDNEVTREGQVRSAFNSPFRPFILASTSVGQEGLDFHHYCGSVMHWNLPSNPVDLEQREGRVNRYKGIVVRKNLAKNYGMSKLKDMKASGQDPWSKLFQAAVMDRPAHMNDLHPYWIYETEGGGKVERNIPLIPLSRDIGHLDNLKRSLVTYRLVFGQPNQEDMLKFLRANVASDEELKEMIGCRIDLQPQ